MRVLLLTQVLPYPPDSGPKVKTWHVIKYLSRQHEVTLASFVRGNQAAAVKELQRYCRAVQTVPMTRSLTADALAMVRSLVRGQPWMMERDDRAAMRQLVDRLAAETSFEIAHADQLNMAQYAARVTGARTVLDAHNASGCCTSVWRRRCRPDPGSGSWSATGACSSATRGKSAASSAPCWP